MYTALNSKGQQGTVLKESKNKSTFAQCRVGSMHSTTIPLIHEVYILTSSSNWLRNSHILHSTSISSQFISHKNSSNLHILLKRWQFIEIVDSKLILDRWWHGQHNRKCISSSISFNEQLGQILSTLGIL